MMKNVWFLVLITFIWFGTGRAQEMTIPMGRIVDSIPAADTTAKSFALYLPTDFSMEKEWPVIFVFDPQGRGGASTQLFRAVSEEQSYIIAASNIVLKEDSLSNNIKKVGPFISQVDAMLPINREQVYVAGLSEGGELASALPLVYSNLSGVLAVGNGWLNTDFLNKSNKFLYSAIACDRNSSMFILEEITDYLEKEDFNTELNFYSCENETEWPDEDVIYNTVSGFTLQALKDDKRPQDMLLVEQLYNAEVAYAEVLRRKRNYFQAFEKLKQIEEKYEKFELDIDLREQIRNIRRNKAFREQRRAYRNIAAEETEKQEEYAYYLETDVVTANFENIGWWAAQKEELAETEKESSGARSKMASRLQKYLEQLSKSYYDSYVTSQADNNTKVFISILRTILDKEDPEAYLNVIKIAGHDGDHKTALIYLEDLLKTGFDKMEALYEIEGIMDLKLSKEYNDKIREYLGEAKYFKAES